ASSSVSLVSAKAGIDNMKAAQAAKAKRFIRISFGPHGDDFQVGAGTAPYKPGFFPELAISRNKIAGQAAPLVRSASRLRSWRLRSLGSSHRLRKRMDFGVTSTSSSSVM